MAVQDLRNKHVLVLGLGTSGIAACHLCRQRGATVTGLDCKPEGALNGEVGRLRDQGVRLILGNDYIEEPADLLVCSPGVSLSHPLIRRCQRLNTPICSEIELASWHCPGPIVAITGTDGKSTVASLVYQALREQGRSARLVGNIGYAFSQMVVDQPPDKATLCVVEVSSYQLELVSDFHPHVAAILNIAPDHLKRHGTLEDYAQVKYRIMRNQTAQDYFVRPLVLPGSFQCRAETLFWATRPHELPGVQFDLSSAKLTLRFAKSTRSFIFPLLSRLMPHQIENILAALCICLPLQLEVHQAVQTMLAFPGLPHRLEYLGKWSGVSYYNDSKATTVHACQAALKGLEGPIILLAGGLEKGEDYRQLAELLRQKVSLVILFGQARNVLQAAWEGVVPLISVPTLEEATRIAVDRATPGDTVLLSPVCASQDRFQDFEQRGNFFKSLVAEWVIEKRA